MFVYLRYTLCQSVFSRGAGWCWKRKRILGNKWGCGDDAFRCRGGENGNMVWDVIYY